MDPKSLSGEAKKFFRLIEFDDKENLICEIRKHPFGLFIIYLGGGFVTTIIFLLLIGGAFFIKGDPLEFGFDLTRARPILLSVGLLLSALSIIVTLIGAYLYKANVILVTSEKIAQILYRTIFDRKISQLNIGDVQDVTITQNGIFARFFDFGTLVIETAGEQQNYTFTYTPRPYDVAKQIVAAHEKNVALYGN